MYQPCTTDIYIHTRAHTRTRSAQGSAASRWYLAWRCKGLDQTPHCMDRRLGQGTMRCTTRFCKKRLPPGSQNQNCSGCPGSCSSGCSIHWPWLPCCCLPHSPPAPRKSGGLGRVENWWPTKKVLGKLWRCVTGRAGRVGCVADLGL